MLASHDYSLSELTDEEEAAIMFSHVCSAAGDGSGRSSAAEDSVAGRRRLHRIRRSGTNEKQTAESKSLWGRSAINQPGLKRRYHFRLGLQLVLLEFHFKLAPHGLEEPKLDPPRLDGIGPVLRPDVALGFQEAMQRKLC